MTRAAVRQVRIVQDQDAPLAVAAGLFAIAAVLLAGLGLYLVLGP